MDIYKLIPGIEAVIVELEGGVCHPVIRQAPGEYQIHICIEGRAEYRMLDGCFQYLGAGDIFMNRGNNQSDVIQLPSGLYRSISITITPRLLPQEHCGIMEIPLKLDIDKVLTTYFEVADDDCFFIPVNKELLGLTAMLGLMKESNRQHYLEIKVAELFLYLSSIDPGQQKKIRIYTREQVEIVKQIEKTLSKDLTVRLTMEQLAEQYAISVTAIKSYFKGVFGMTLNDYMIKKRMMEAAHLLKDSDLPISAVASKIGYASQSKFTSTFKKTYHMNPMRYRKSLRSQTGKRA